MGVRQSRDLYYLVSVKSVLGISNYVLRYLDNWQLVSHLEWNLGTIILNHIQ